MTTIFGAFQDKGSIAASGYGPLLETIAPGISALIESVRRFQQSWADVLEQELPFIEMTDEQRMLLQSQIINYREGIAAPLIIDPRQSLAAAQKQLADALATSSAQKPDLVRTISYISAGLSVIKWIT